jgi:UDP-N-acetyl-2-amino-2-deoxyglucuronate dehydrogenase
MVNNLIPPRVRAKLKRHLLDAVNQRGLIRGYRIEFRRRRHCELREFEDSMPGPGEVIVETALSAISPGTERAVYLGLPNVPFEYPYVPGSGQVGRIVVAGAGAELQVGQTVFTAGPHASLYRCSSAEAITLPPGVSDEAAALTHMGFVALHGVRNANIEPGERVVVLGCGLVGQLVAQLAQLAGGEVVAVATSPERLEVAKACGVRRVVDIRREATAFPELRADVVIDATGNPEAIRDSATAAGQRARLILLGSSRGVSRGLDLARWQEKELKIIGAHVRTVPVSDEIPGVWSWRRECETFLHLLAQRRVVVTPLISRRSPPTDAPRVFADLSRADDKSVAVLLDWSQPGSWKTRVETVSSLRVAVAGIRMILGSRAAAAPVFLSRRNDGRVLRFGLIGCGEIAVESAAALRAAANATITFAADLNVELARSLTVGTDARYSRNVDELLASREVDAVVISTPHHLHSPLAIQAAKAGKHVVVEKPMATTLEDCDRMINAARRAGVMLSVCYCQRYDPRVQRARQLLDSGLLGDIRSTRIAFGQYRGPEYWTWGLTGRVTSDWRSKRETAGGGVLIMNACHILDYMAWLVGSPVAEVSAVTANFSGLAEVEDTVSMSYRYATGAIGTLEATTGLLGPDTYEQSLRGADGQLVVAPMLHFWSRRTADGYESGRVHALRGLPRPAERRHFFEAFAQAVLDGRPTPVTATEARAVQATIEAAYRSAAERQTVRVAISDEPSRTTAE